MKTTECLNIAIEGKKQNAHKKTLVQVMAWCIHVLLNCKELIVAVVQLIPCLLDWKGL